MDTNGANEANQITVPEKTGGPQHDLTADLLKGRTNPLESSPDGATPGPLPHKFQEDAEDSSLLRGLWWQPLLNVLISVSTIQDPSLLKSLRQLCDMILSMAKTAWDLGTISILSTCPYTETWCFLETGYMQGYC